MDAESIRQLILNALPEDMRCRPVYVYDSLGSTNTRAKELFLQGEPDWTLVVAREQTAGRGRHGRSFFSPGDAGLYMSILLRLPELFLSPQNLTVSGAVACAKAIEALTGLSPGIKWVNDLYLNGLKVCGILCEAVTDDEGKPQGAVLGIGVNCRAAKSGFPAELSGKAGALDTDVSPWALAAEITVCLKKLLSRGALPIEEYRRRCLMPGRKVSFCLDGAQYTATAQGISDSGQLLVRLDDESLLSLNSGEVSVYTCGGWT